jgi:hypothetical protein
VETYLESFCKDTKQLAYGRTELVKAAREVVSRAWTGRLWCGFSQVSERYFEIHSQRCHWTNTEKMQLLEGWLQLTLPAFVPDSENHRIAINDMRAWVQRYADLKGRHA